MKTSFKDTSLRRRATNPPLTIFGVTIVAVIFWGYFTFEKANRGELKWSLGATCIYAIVIIILQIVYRLVAEKVTNYENHKYNENWENSHLIKVFCFSFVNAYISLFAYAFADINFNKVAETLAVNLAAKQIGMNFVDIYLP
jgi:small-conductance mechanosensitive channel